MHKTFTIAAREYLAAVRTKSFLATLVFMPLLMGGSIAAQVLLEEMSTPPVKRFAVLDRTPGRHLERALVAAAAQRETISHEQSQFKRRPDRFLIVVVEPSIDSSSAIDEQRYLLSEQVAHGELAGFLDIGPDVIQTRSGDEQQDAGRATVRYQSNSPLYDQFQRWAERTINEAVVAQRCTAAGLPAGRVQALVQPVNFRVKGLSQRDVQSGQITDASDQSQAALVLVPVGLTGLMFLVIMVGATPLMQGVVEEKAQRIAEVLLGSVHPFVLMSGKLIGMMGVSLTIAGVYLGGAYWIAGRFGILEYLPLDLLAWFIAYQVLAVLMYGSLFIAVGAACSDMKETQMLLLPIILLICIPMFTLRNVLQEPNGAYATWVSFFPPATPMLMIARLAVRHEAPLWQPALGAVGVVAATILCIYAAGRIFRVGILMQGKGARLGELARWVIRG